MCRSADRALASLMAFWIENADRQASATLAIRRSSISVGPLLGTPRRVITSREATRGFGAVAHCWHAVRFADDLWSLGRLRRCPIVTSMLPVLTRTAAGLKWT